MKGGNNVRQPKNSRSNILQSGSQIVEDQVKESLLQVMGRKATALKSRPRQLTTVTITLASPVKQQQQQLYDTNENKLLMQSQLGQKDINSYQNGKVDALQVLKKWREQNWQSKGVEGYLAMKSTAYRKYKFNIYILQRSALVIQHWYFKKQAKIQKADQLLLQQWGSIAPSHQSTNTKRKDDFILTIHEKERDALMKLVALRLSPGQQTPSPEPQKQQTHHIKIVNPDSPLKAGRPQNYSPPIDRKQRSAGSRNRLSKANGIQNNNDLSQMLKKLQVKRESSEGSNKCISSIEYSIITSFKEPTLLQVHKSVNNRDALFSDKAGQHYGNISPAKNAIVTPKKFFLHNNNSALDKFNTLAQNIEEQTYFNKRSEGKDFLSGINTRSMPFPSQRSAVGDSQYRSISQGAKLIAFKPSKEMQEALNVREGENKAKQIFDNFAREREFMNNIRRGSAGRSMQDVSFHQEEVVQQELDNTDRQKGDTKQRPVNLNFKSPKEEDIPRKSSQRVLDQMRQRQNESERKIQINVELSDSKTIDERGPRHIHDVSIVMESKEFEYAEEMASSGEKPTHHRQYQWFAHEKSMSPTTSRIENSQEQKELISKFIYDKTQEDSPRYQEHNKLFENTHIKASKKAASPHIGLHLFDRITFNEPISIKFTNSPPLQEGNANNKEDQVVTLRNSLDSATEPTTVQVTFTTDAPPPPTQPSKAPTNISPNPTPQRKSPIPQQLEKKPLQQRPAASQSQTFNSRSTSIGKSLSAILNQKLQRTRGIQEEDKQTLQISESLRSSGINPLSSSQSKDTQDYLPKRHEMTLDSYKQVTLLSKFTRNNQQAHPSMLSSFKHSFVHTPQQPTPVDKQAKQKPQANMPQASLYGVQKLTQYKRLQKSQESIHMIPKETPRTVLPTPEKKPVLLLTAQGKQPQNPKKTFGLERSSVFEILKRNKSFEKLEPLSLLNSKQNTDQVRQKREQYEKLKAQSRVFDNSGATAAAATADSSKRHAKQQQQQQNDSKLTFEEFKVLQHHKRKQEALRGNVSVRSSIGRGSSNVKLNKCQSSPYMKTLLSSYIQGSNIKKPELPIDLTPPKLQIAAVTSRNNQADMSSSKKHNFNPSNINQRMSIISQADNTIDSSLMMQQQRGSSKKFTPILSERDTPVKDRDGSMGHLMSTESFQSKYRDKHFNDQTKRIGDIEVSQERHSIMREALQRSSIVINNSLQS